MTDKPPFPQKKKDSRNAEFSKRVQAKIKTLISEGKDPDQAAAIAYSMVKKEMAGDSLARMTREGLYEYWEADEWKLKRKKFEELKKAVDRLDGRPLPAYPHHEDADDITKCIGLYYNIVADETTRSVYGDLYPQHERGTMNSIGFMCDEVEAADGIIDQVNIDLDHVAVSPGLIGRGGETVSVIDMADQVDYKKQLDEVVKAKADEIAAFETKLKAADALIKAKDAEIEILKAKSASVGDEVKLLKERLDAITKANEQKEKSEVIASILDPRRKLGDERTKALKTKLEGLDLAGVKALREFTDLTAPIRADDTVDEKTGLFPPAQNPRMSALFDDSVKEYRGNVF